MSIVIEFHGWYGIYRKENWLVVGFVSFCWLKDGLEGLIWKNVEIGWDLCEGLNEEDIRVGRFVENLKPWESIDRNDVGFYTVPFYGFFDTAIEAAVEFEDEHVERKDEELAPPAKAVK